MLGYLTIHQSTPGPLFLLQDGSLFSRPRLIGAAIMAARMGVSDSLTKTWVVGSPQVLHCTFGPHGSSSWQCHPLMSSPLGYSLTSALKPGWHFMAWFISLLLLISFIFCTVLETANLWKAGWCTAQWKMLLFYMKPLLKESHIFELAHLKKQKKKKKKKKKKKEKHFGHLATFWFCAFAMLISATGWVFRHENTRKWTIGCYNGL